MKSGLIVVDANIFAKLLFAEPDSAEARMFFKCCAKTNTKLIVPELFKYEIAQIARYYQHPLHKTLDIFAAHEQSILTTISPRREVWLLAEKIASDGHEKSGFPSIYDSIYQALAIDSNATFLTADKRHYEKAKKHGHIILLSEWESLFLNNA